MPKLEKIQGHSHLYRHPKSGIVYLRASYPGLGEITRSTRECDLKKALHKSRELEKQFLKLDPNYQPRTFEEIARDWFDMKSIRWRQSTIDDNVMHILEKRLIPNFGHLAIEKIDEKVWARYARDFYDKTPQATLFNTRKWLVSIMNYARNEGYVQKKYSFLINDRPPREGLVISEVDFQKIVASAQPKMRLIASFGYYMGMRPGEITNLSRNRVDTYKPSINLRAEDVKTGSKTRRGREIAIAPEVMLLLLPWLREKRSVWVFPAREVNGPMQDAHTNWDRLITKLELPPYNLNDLRHTFLTRKLLVERKNPLEVALYAGTSLEVIQKTYLHHKFENTRSVVEDSTKKVRKSSELT